MSLRSNLVWIMNHIAFRKKPFGGDEAQNSQILIQDSQKCRDCGFQLCVNWVSLHYVARSQFDYKPKRCTGPNPSKMSIHLHPFALFDPPKWVFEWSLPKLNKFDESLRSFRWRFFCSFSPSWKQPSPFGESNAGWAHELGKKTSSGNAVQKLFRQDTMNKHRIQNLKFPWCLHTFWWAVS